MSVPSLPTSHSIARTIRCWLPSPSWLTTRRWTYRSRNFPQLGQPIPADFAAPAEMVARVYAMVTNIDTNVGKVFKALESKGRGRQHDRGLSHR